MKRNVDALVLTSVNTCWRTPITLQTLLHLLRSQDAPGPQWIGHVRQFFTDVPVGALERFCTRNGLSPQTIRRYYETYILPLGDHNPDLERWMYKDTGALVRTGYGLP